MKLTLVAVLLAGAVACVLCDDDNQVSVDAPHRQRTPKNGKTPPPHGRARRAATCGAQTRFSASQATESVYSHNLWRSKEPAANMKAFTWSEEMAAVAQAWANTCKWEHGMLYDCTGNRLGQNLFVEASSLSYPAMNVTGVITAWNNERKDYTYSTGTCAAGKVCGHWTQVAWAKSLQVGCAYAQCPTMVVSGATWKNALYVVCDYTPAGNVAGEKPYISGTPCSQCDAEKTGAGYKCVNNLCSKCSPATDSTCKCGTPLVCKNGGTWSTTQCQCNCGTKFYGQTCEHQCTCGDEDPTNCPDWVDYCEDPDYSDYMESQCKGTCSFPCSLPSNCATSG